MKGEGGSHDDDGVAGRDGAAGVGAAGSSFAGNYAQEPAAGSGGSSSTDPEDAWVDTTGGAACVIEPWVLHPMSNIAGCELNAPSGQP